MKPLAEGPKPLAEGPDLKIFDEGRSSRLTVADALDFLRKHPCYQAKVSCEIYAGPLPLPSRKPCFIVLVACKEIGWAVTLPTSVNFKAKCGGDSSSLSNTPEIMDLASSLNGAIVNDEGIVTLHDGRRLRSVEMIAARLPPHGDGQRDRKHVALREAVIEFLVRKQKNNGSRYRYLDLKFGPVDYSKLKDLSLS